LWLGLVAVATFPELHDFFHSDAGLASHDCLVTQFSQNQLLNAGSAVVVVAAALVFLGLPPLFQRLAPRPADVRLASSRAPPVRSLLPL